MLMQELNDVYVPFHPSVQNLKLFWCMEPMFSIFHDSQVTFEFPAKVFDSVPVDQVVKLTIQYLRWSIPFYDRIFDDVFPVIPREGFAKACWNRAFAL